LGGAGTGKTTFLKELKGKTYKRMVVAAPTGVAAINAEGMTIHSLFCLPTEPLDPLVIQRIRLTSVSRNLLKSIDLLVLDEGIYD